MSRSPLFLERRSYRMRRMMDAVRLLPWLGFALFMLPLIWPVPDQTAAVTVHPVPMSVALRYLFGVWAGLILCCGALWWWTRASVSETSVASPRSEPGPD